MIAMILAAGLGTRLKDITKTTPKCLVDIDGRTMLDILLERLEISGFTRAVINLFHLGDQVRAHIEKNYQGKLKINFSEEKELLGTGGGVKNARDFLASDKNFLIHNADVFMEFDLQNLFFIHESNKSLATLAVMKRPTNRHLLFNDNFELAGWDNGDKTLRLKDGVNEYAFSGVQVVSGKIFEYMERQAVPFSLITTYMNCISENESIRGHDIKGAYWIDVGTQEKLRELRQRFQRF